MSTYTLRSANPAKTRCDAVVVGVVQGGKGLMAAPGAEEVASAYGRSFRPLLASLGVTGKPGDLEKDREKIRVYIAKLKGFEGLAGPIAFNEHGDAVKRYFIVEGRNGAWTTKVRGCSVEGACMRERTSASTSSGHSGSRVP